MKKKIPPAYAKPKPKFIYLTAPDEGDQCFDSEPFDAAYLPVGKSWEELKKAVAKTCRVTKGPASRTYMVLAHNDVPDDCDKTQRFSTGFPDGPVKKDTVVCDLAAQIRASWLYTEIFGRKAELTYEDDEPEYRSILSLCLTCMTVERKEVGEDFSAEMHDAWTKIMENDYSTIQSKCLNCRDTGQTADVRVFFEDRLPEIC